MAEGTGISPVKRSSDVQTSRPSERSAEAIRQDIVGRRDNISQTVDLLGERIQDTFNWRQHVAKHPFLSMALAGAAGLFVSRIFRRRPSPAERIMDAVADVVEDVTDQARDAVGGLFGGGRGRGVIASTVAAITARAAGSLFQKITKED